MPTLENALHHLLHKHYNAQTPGAMVCIARYGAILFEGGAGAANLETGAPITSETTFRLASVSKQFTAMCVHLLAQHGQLQLHDQLSAYFPELAHFGDIRLSNLLNHTSGLPDFEEVIPSSQTEQLTDEDVLHLTSKQTHVFFPAGARYRYSNTAYVLLGLLVERVSGSDYADFLQDNIFRPLQMHSTRFYSKDASIQNRATGYTWDAHQGIILTDQNIGTATRGDGCIYTSAQDYLKWHIALSNLNLFNINKAIKDNCALVEQHKPWGYSMGWFISDCNSYNPELYHSGDTSGFTNLIIRLPYKDTLVACFSNIANNQHFLNELLDTLQQFPEFFPSSELVSALPRLTR
ncbi:serine hydrolase domain-containing protein [Pontibacter oryzae]|uniref:Class A beta-lactamase-related serine hydrolase n=1 Tax=Pontibacter oryzae TaxID=2304593 RepID=A0A399SGT8_9BACT|nr:serine hydrolase domain-containing protein [Pontibacter oryzae]RIJ42321.1 class A beta-lactamase-related serine hydrolase [Pontibacter oryzae]